MRGDSVHLMVIFLNPIIMFKLILKPSTCFSVAPISWVACD